MANPLMITYFRTWLQRTFDKPWTIAMVVAGVLGIPVSYITDRNPDLAPFANRAAWQLPVTLFILTLVPAAMRASWKLYKEVLELMAKRSEEADMLREQLSTKTYYEGPFS